MLLYLGITTLITTFTAIVESVSAKSVFHDYQGYPSELIPIPLSFNEGVTINTKDLNDPIINLWLDNPNFVTFVTNCTGDQDSNCNVDTIHLRRIQDLNIPSFQSAGSTILTLRFNSGKMIKARIYKATSTEILGFNFTLQSKNREPAVNIVLPHEKDYPLIYAVLRGIHYARNHDFLDSNSPLNEQLAIFVDHLWYGYQESEARSRANLTAEFVNTIKEMGGYINYPLLLRRGR